MDLENVWTDLVRQIKSYPNVNASQIDAFFSRVQLQAASTGFVMLTSDNGFIKDWIEKHYMQDIRNALKDLYGVDFIVQIEIDPTAAPAPQPTAEPAAAPQSSFAQAPAPTPARAATAWDDAASGAHASAAPATPAAPVAPAAPDASATPAREATTPAHDAAPAPDDAVVPPRTGTPDRSRRDELMKRAGNPLDDPQREENQTAPDQEYSAASSLTFDTFVIGDSNRMAYSMAVEVADRPGTSTLNPLFIYGRSGVGKTHLLCAIQNYIREQYSDFNVCYIDSMELVNKYSDAAIEKSVDKQSFKNFESFFQQADVLLIDDIQGLQGKPGTLNALFRIFNSMIAKGKQFVFSADRAPKNIDLDERYVTRFNSGATIDIQPPDDETKRNIIKGFIAQYRQNEGLSFTIPDKALDYIVENSSSNIRELKSAITNVIFAIKMDQDHELSEHRIQELLGNHFLGGGKKRITVEMIQGAVEDFYGIPHKDLVGKKKERRIVHPRQVAIYLCRELSEDTLKSIGNAFNRDHTTVMHSCDLINNQLQEDRNLREELEAIREKIRIQQY